MTSSNSSADTCVVHYKTARIHHSGNDLDIFYREAGAKDAPVILLLHGFPTSSNHVPQSDSAACGLVPTDCT